MHLCEPMRFRFTPSTSNLTHESEVSALARVIDPCRWDAWEPLPTTPGAWLGFLLPFADAGNRHGVPMGAGRLATLTTATKRKLREGFLRCSRPLDLLTGHCQPASPQDGAACRLPPSSDLSAWLTCPRPHSEPAPSHPSACPWG